MAKYILTMLGCAFVFICMSCASTCQYTKERTELYENGVLVSLTETLSRDGKAVKSKHYEADCKRITAQLNEPVPENGYAEVTFHVTDDNAHLSALQTDNTAESVDYALVATEQLSLTFKPDLTFIFYNIGVRPTIIAMSALGGILYPFYPAAIDLHAGLVNSFDWLGYVCPSLGHGEKEPFAMLSLRQSLKKLKKTRADAAFPEYPEFHRPFMETHITADVMKSEIINISSENERKVRVISKDSFTTGVKRDISKEISADAHLALACGEFVSSFFAVPLSIFNYVLGYTIGMTVSILVFPYIVIGGLMEAE